VCLTVCEVTENPKGALCSSWEPNFHQQIVSAASRLVGYAKSQRGHSHTRRILHLLALGSGTVGARSSRNFHTEFLHVFLVSIMLTCPVYCPLLD
jgi:hypothetical protein